MKNKMGLGKFLKIYALCFGLVNIPQFAITYTTPREELKPTLSEHLSEEMSELRDFSGGNFYAHFQLLGSTTGYLAKRLAVNIENRL